MLIGLLQSLAFIFAALLLTIWKSFVRDYGKFKAGICCLLASIAMSVSGLIAEWIGIPTSYYYYLGYAAGGLFALSVLLTIESLLAQGDGANTVAKKTDSDSS